MAVVVAMAELEATDKTVEMGGMVETIQLRATATMVETQHQEAMVMGAMAAVVVSMVVMGAMGETVTAEEMAEMVEMVLSMVTAVTGAMED
ncbi:hypothetical protein MMK73_002607 [Providencia rettgeri]|nr:hypothetical protein [Providencia rettgeri]